MYIPLKKSIKHRNSKNCVVYEYDVNDKTLSAATAIIKGRYPDNGSVMNTACVEAYYVISGSGIVHSDRGDFKIKKGDLYFFEKNERYWIIGKELFIFISNSPAFCPEQHMSIDQ